MSIKHPHWYLLFSALRQVFCMAYLNPVCSEAWHEQSGTYAELWGLQAQLYQPG